MNFYEVAPASRQYHGSTPLTYSYAERLTAGRVVVVKIRSKTVMAFVVREVEKPTFKTLPVEEATAVSLPLNHVALFDWLCGYYPAPLGLIAQQFLPLANQRDYVISEPVPNTIGNIPDLPALTTDQQKAVAQITTSHTPVMLHGNTGTGKTRVYIELAKQTIKAGKSVLVLVPEIALSPQIVKTFESALAAPVTVTHSGLTTVKRRQAWQNILATTVPQVVIGPRSALFMPLNDIGLIVIDEFHEPAYKQDQAPYYQTIRAASQLARLHGAQLILGSATPLISEYYIAEQKQLPIIRMQQKAAAITDVAKTTSYLVNIRDSEERTRYPLLTQTLVERMAAALARKEQVLLFLNKRGSARLILCQTCGWHALCDRCDLPYTYHGDTHRLQCHTCGNHIPAPSVCPACTSHDIIFKSPGTKAIVEAVTHAFPDARIARFDKDNRKAERLETRHGEIMRGEIDILIGTQLLAKGHDLPRLSLVGILLAENELQFPDYTSSERSYQLMHQLIGRVGRGHRDGEVVVQTYDPENIAVQTAIGNYTWQQFYDAQLAERQQFEFPPFFYLMKIEVTRVRPQTVTSACHQIMKFLSESGEPIKVSGPTPSFIEKNNNTWTWQIIVKAKQRTALTRLARSIPIKCIINLDPSNLL
ncbi:MAG: replication restart helicase PriA [Candidatus Saccharimonadales bacterium]